jgi:hypothetical protein
VNPVRAALYTRLTGDDELADLLSLPTAVHHAVAPPNAHTPYVIFHKQAGTPEWQFGQAYIQWDVWTVKAVDRADSASTAEAIAARIDLVLNHAPLEIEGGLLLGVWRIADVDYPENDGGETYRHVGGQYRLVTQPA